MCTHSVVESLHPEERCIPLVPWQLSLRKNTQSPRNPTVCSLSHIYYFPSPIRSLRGEAVEFVHDDKLDHKGELSCFGLSERLVCVLRNRLDYCGIA